MLAKKIYINKSDEIGAVVDRVLSAKEKIIILSVPKFSKLALVDENLALLKREIDAVNKTVRIESVDDRVLILANSLGIEASNPFFVQLDEKPSRVMDITPIKRSSGSAKLNKFKVDAPITLVNYKEENLSNVEDDQENIEAEAEAELEKKFGPVAESFSVKPKLRSLSIVFLVLIFSGVLTYLAFVVMPKASIKVVAEKRNFNLANVVIADKTIRSVDSQNLKIPGQVFTEKRNITLTFKANGKKQVSKKSGGVVALYNAYSSANQVLVATTRLQTPDGKIFRLVKTVTVPGAKIEDGKIVPSVIEAEVVADLAGVAYNIPTASRFTIPGLKGTPRYSSFYGESKTSFSGGFVGELAYPTDIDIKKGKDAVLAGLEDNAKTILLQKVPQEFKMMSDSVKFNLVKQTVNTEINDQGLFSIYAEGAASAIVFKESDLMTMLRAKITEKEGNNFEIKNQTLNYVKVAPDLLSGKLVVSIDFKAQLSQSVKVDDLRNRILGKSETDLRALLLSFSGLDSAQISFWPFWVHSVPNNGSKVNIVVE